MKKQMMEILSAVIVDETVTFSAQEISYTCGISIEIIEEMVEHGLVEPQKSNADDWQFDPQALRRVKVALRLQKDLGVNLAGAALALDLVNELQALRNQIAL